MARVVVNKSVSKAQDAKKVAIKLPIATKKHLNTKTYIKEIKDTISLTFLTEVRAKKLHNGDPKKRLYDFAIVKIYTLVVRMVTRRLIFA
ncbi:hypothetical protein AYI68_g5582 [Smittium mucronatum]|uniref:Uncharacterized protein n=1 Tax=Smittium mucronatum TaxID=133383 RepID=A0A1R0GTV0_9FUNG|nr:hypothetical protein AYI68_g5582 [Smittium mucronatum]